MEQPLLHIAVSDSVELPPGLARAPAPAAGSKDALLTEVDLDSTDDRLHVASYRFRLLVIVLTSTAVMVPWCHSLKLQWIFLPAGYAFFGACILLIHQSRWLSDRAATLPFLQRLRISIQLCYGVREAVAVHELPAWFAECLLVGFVYIFSISLAAYFRVGQLPSDDEHVEAFISLAQQLLFRHGLLSLVTALMLLVVIEHRRSACDADREDDDGEDDNVASDEDQSVIARLRARQVNLSITRAHALILLGRWSGGEGVSRHRIDPDQYYARVSTILSEHARHLRPALYAQPPTWTWEKVAIVVAAFFVTWQFGSGGFLGYSPEYEWATQLIALGGRIALVFTLSPLLFALRVPYACYEQSQLLMHYVGQSVQRISYVDDVLVWVSVRHHYLSHLMPLQYERAQYCFVGSLVLILVGALGTFVGLFAADGHFGRDAITFVIAVCAGGNVWYMLSRAVDIVDEQQAHVKLLHFRAISLKAQLEHAKQMSASSDLSAPPPPLPSPSPAVKSSLSAPPAKSSATQGKLLELESALALIERILPIVATFDEQPEALGVSLTRTFRTLLFGYLTTALVAITTKVLVDQF